MKAEWIERVHWPPDGSRVLCAVSGGADSMCLLALLRGQCRFTVAAAHVEHGIRGAEGLRDCAFVEDYCRARAIPCYVAHVDAPGFAARRGLSLETAARELRYDFLERTAAAEGFDYIATAHTADDNAETILLNFARGAGLRGLGGIPPQRGKILRPLLKITRTEVEYFLRASDTPHVEDGTNASDAYSRNRIRHTVTPALRELNPAFALAAARTASLLRRDEEYLDGEAARFLSRRFDGESLPAAELAALHAAVASRAVRKLLPRAAEEGHIEAILALCRSSERGYADVPGLRVRCERGRLYFAPDDGAAIGETALAPGAAVTLAAAGLRVRCRLADAGEEIHNSFKTYCLRYESICGDLSVSSPRAGESYRPAGRGCTKTLKSLFAECRATERSKRLTPVFRDREGIVLVPPFGAAERCVPAAGEKLLVIEIENNLE